MMTSRISINSIISTIISSLMAAALAACSSGPPTPDWKMNAQSSIERFEAAYLSGKTLVENAEFKRARDEISATGKIDLVLRLELVRCATHVASLAFDDCSGFDKLSQDAAPADRAYAAYLAGKAQAGDIALLPEQHRAAAGANSESAAAAAVAAIKDPLAQLVAAGVLFRTNRASPALLATAVDTASAQGWRRPLLAWLGVQALRAQQAGDTQEAQRLRRRMDLVEGKDSAGNTVRSD